MTDNKLLSDIQTSIMDMQNQMQSTYKNLADITVSGESADKTVKIIMTATYAFVDIEFTEKTLSDALKQAVLSVGQCQRCRQFTEQTVCSLCSNPKRNHTLLCIVESPSDVIALEQTHAFQGVYFVLHGHLSPLDGISPDNIGIPQLLTRLKEEPIQEVILATNPTIEGKATAQYIANLIDTRKMTCTRIAHGVPMGGELEYLDGSTLSHAFYSRIIFS